MSNYDCHACKEYNELSRRQFLGATGGVLTLLAAGAPAWMPRIALAKHFLANRDVLVLVFLRGAADGLTLCVPYGDPQYYVKRPMLGIVPPDTQNPNAARDLNGYFGLAPAMAALLPAYNAGNLLIVHATGSTDSSRSHFDAQRFMELGKPNDPTLFTGWFGRHLITTAPPITNPPPILRALTQGYQLDTMLAANSSSIPELPVPNLASYGITGQTSTKAARLQYINQMYNAVADPVRSAALNTQATINLLTAINFTGYTPGNGAVYPTSSFGQQLKNAAALIRADVGVEAVSIDKSGWDTHSAQGVLSGSMAVSMQDLAGGLAAFHQDIIASTTRCTVVVMSEFGRRVAENASLGTDHGHGNAMFILGGGIAGGRVLTNWPTLGSLYQNLDLQVTIDYRDILAEILANRVQNTSLSTVFPDPAYTPTFRGVTL